MSIFLIYLYVLKDDYINTFITFLNKQNRGGVCGCVCVSE